MNAYRRLSLRSLKFNRAHILWDSFTDDNGLPIHQHTPERAPAGSAWQQTGAYLEIQNNALTMNSTGNMSAEIESGVCDFRLDIQAHTGITTGLYGWGFNLHIVDASNYWWLMTLPSEMRIYEKSAGSFNLRASQAVTLAPDQDYFSRAVSLGDTIQFRVGANILRYTAQPNPHKAASRVAVQLRTAAAASAFTRLDDLKLYRY